MQDFVHQQYCYLVVSNKHQKTTLKNWTSAQKKGETQEKPCFKTWNHLNLGNTSCRPCMSMMSTETPPVRDVSSSASLQKIPLRWDRQSLPGYVASSAVRWFPCWSMGISAGFFGSIGYCQLSARKIESLYIRVTHCWICFWKEALIWIRLYVPRDRHIGWTTSLLLQLFAMALSRKK